VSGDWRVVKTTLELGSYIKRGRDVKISDMGWRIEWRHQPNKYECAGKHKIISWKNYNSKYVPVKWDAWIGKYNGPILCENSK
jgi:hypothetical protein